MNERDSRKTLSGGSIDLDEARAVRIASETSDDIYGTFDGTDPFAPRSYPTPAKHDKPRTGELPESRLED